MKTYIVSCVRMVRQHVSVPVVAESQREACQLVRDGIVPAQWPDGTYVEDTNAFGFRASAVVQA